MNLHSYILRVPWEKQRVYVLGIFVILAGAIPQINRYWINATTLAFIPAILGGVIAIYWFSAPLSKRVAIAFVTGIAIFVIRWVLTSVWMKFNLITFLATSGETYSEFATMVLSNFFGAVMVVVSLDLFLPLDKRIPAKPRRSWGRVSVLCGALVGVCVVGLAVFELPWLRDFSRIRAAALRERPVVDELRKAGCEFNQKRWRYLSGGSLLTDWAMKGPYAQIEDIRFTRKDVSAVSFAGMGKLDELASVDLSDTNVRTEQLAGFSGTDLVELNLSRTVVTAAGLQHLAGLERLTYLRLDGSSVTDEEMATFKPGSLSELSLADTSISDSGMTAIGGFTNLTNLDLSRTKVGDTGIACLRFRGLSSLNLSGTTITDRTLEMLRERYGNHRLALNVAHTRISDAGLKACGRMFLAELDLTGTDVSDQGLEELRGLDWLQVVHVGGTRVTSAGANALLQAHAARRAAFFQRGDDRRGIVSPSDLKVLFADNGTVATGK